MAASSKSSPRGDAFDARQRRLLLLAWAATLLPLFAFAYLTWQSWQVHRHAELAEKRLGEMTAETAKLEDTKARLLAEISHIQSDLESQRQATKHYRDFAGIRIRFYRESDREVVEQALTKLGFKIDSTLGASKLINLKPNTIAYGKDVSPLDLQDIAVALAESGFPLKRIAPASRQPDAKLIQIYASAESDRDCGLLNPAQIRKGDTCGVKPQ